MLAYRVAYFLPKHRDAMVTARALDFPGLVSEGWNVAEARTKITAILTASAHEYQDAGRALPTPDPNANDASADLLEIVAIICNWPLPPPG